MLSAPTTGAADATSRRARKTWIRLLGLLAGGVLGWFVLAYLTRPPPVESWLETVAAGDRADALWAFEELKRSGDESLIHLARHVDRVEPAAPRGLCWVGPGLAARYHPREGPITVGLVARFVLRHRLGSRAPELLPTARAVDEGDVWRAATAEFLAQESHSPGGLWPALRRAVLSGVRAAPPSWRLGLGRLRREQDAAALLEVAAGGAIAEARWAQEVLQELPDEALDHLAAEAASERESSIDFVSCEDCPSSASGKCTLGRIVRLILGRRLGREPHLELQSPMPEAERAQETQEAWRRYRSGMSPR